MKHLNPKKIKDRIMEIGYKTGASHVASAMSCVNVLCDLYNKWPDAIVILSKAHGALALYVILNELGKLPDDILATYHKDGGLSVHATLDQEHGIMASCGSLGHGLPIGIGYAIANPDKLVIVLMSDGELEEGSTLEALQIINRLHIKNIIPVVDQNDCQGFKESEDILPPVYKKYYSVKGEGFGEEFEGKVSSHYQTITEPIYNNWKKVSKQIEQHRLKVIRDYKLYLKNKKNEAGNEGDN